MNIYHEDLTILLVIAAAVGFAIFAQVTISGAIVNRKLDVIIKLLERKL